MSKVDRRAALRKHNQEQGDSNRFTNQKTIIKSEEELAEFGITYYPLKSGDNGTKRTHSLHWLAPHKDDGVLISLELYVHYSVGPENSQFLCPKMMKKVISDNDFYDGLEVPDKFSSGKCPICEQRDAVWSEAQDIQRGSAEWDAIKQAAKPFSCFPPRYLIWIRDANDPNKGGTQVTIFPSSVHDELSSLCDSDAESGGEIVDPSDPEDGRIVRFTREGKGQFNTKYKTYQIKTREAIPASWADVPHYFDVLNICTYEEIAEEFGSGPPVTTDNKSEAKSKEKPDDELPENTDKEDYPTDKAVDEYPSDDYPTESTETVDDSDVEKAKSSVAELRERNRLKKQKIDKDDIPF